MCSEASIQGVKTNHSLLATVATHMFQSGVPGKSHPGAYRASEGLR